MLKGKKYAVSKQNSIAKSESLHNNSSSTSSSEENFIAQYLRLWETWEVVVGQARGFMAEITQYEITQYNITG